MKIYQPTVLNTVDPYSGNTPWGFPEFNLVPIQTTVATNSLSPAYNKTYNGLSEDLEMRPRGGTGRPTIPGSQPTGTTTRPPVILDPRNQQIISSRTEPTRVPTIVPQVVNAAPTMPAVFENITIQPTVKPWYKSPIYYAVLAAAAYFAAKKFKIIK